MKTEAPGRGTRRLFALHRTVVAAFLPQRPDVSGPILATYVNAEAGSVNPDARPVAMVVIIVPVTVVHVQAVAAVETPSSTEAVVAALPADAVRASGRCQQCCSGQRRSGGSHERDHAHGFTSSSLQALTTFESAPSSEVCGRCFAVRLNETKIVSNPNEIYLIVCGGSSLYQIVLLRVQKVPRVRSDASMIQLLLIDRRISRGHCAAQRKRRPRLWNAHSESAAGTQKLCSKWPIPVIAIRNFV
jgi:hypothetical protein